MRPRPEPVEHFGFLGLVALVGRLVGGVGDGVNGIPVVVCRKLFNG